MSSDNKPELVSTKPSAAHKEKNPFLDLVKTYMDEAFADTAAGVRALATNIIAGAFLAEQRTGGSQHLLVVTNDGLEKLLQAQNIPFPKGVSVGEVAGIVNSGLAVLREKAGLDNPKAEQRILK